MKRQGRRSDRRAAYTLLEMVIAASVGSILLAGLAGTIAASMQSWSATLSPRREAKTSEATRRMHNDLQSALEFIERTDRAATFLIPDRDGDGARETIRYAWSGTPGDPLTVAFNGQPAENFVEGLQDFELGWTSRAVVAPAPPAVAEEVGTLVFLSSGTGAPGEVNLTSQESQKVAFLQGEHDVLTVSASMSQSAMETVLEDTRVVYVSGSISGSVFPRWLAQSTVGIVAERPDLSRTLGMSVTGRSYFSTRTMPTYLNHDITGSLRGSVAIAPGGQPLTELLRPHSPDLRVLGVISREVQVSLAALEAGSVGVEGTDIPGRRVMLPVGGPGSNFASLTADTHSIILNAVQWAAQSRRSAPLNMRVLLVIGSFNSPYGFECDRYYFLRTLGCQVDLINPAASRAQYDAALAKVDAVWLTTQVHGRWDVTWLSDCQLPVIMERSAWLGIAGIGTHDFAPVHSTFTLTASNHPILQGIRRGDLLISQHTAGRMSCIDPAPGMEVLAVAESDPSFIVAGVVEKGAQTHDEPAPGRRIWLSCLDNLYSVDMEVEFQDLIVSVLKWSVTD